MTPRRGPHGRIVAALAAALPAPIVVLAACLAWPAAGTADMVHLFYGGNTPGFTAGTNPNGITTGPDHNIWFTESANPGGVARVNADGTVTELRGGMTPGFTANRYPDQVTAGSDGNVWFTERDGIGAVARVNPDGTVTELTGGVTPGFTARAHPTGIATGVDGKIWFTEPQLAVNGQVVGGLARVNADGSVTEFPGGTTPGLSVGAEPWGLTKASQGGIVAFTEYADPGGLGVVNSIGDGSVTEFGPAITPGFSANRKPNMITTDAAGNIWVTERGGSGTAAGVARLNGDGSVTELGYGTPGWSISDGLPEGITTGPDHNIWFTQRYASALVRVNGDGSVTEFPAGPLNGLYDGANPTGITAGPDGHVWFTEGGDPNYAQPGAVGYINGPDAYTYNASGTGTSSRTLSGHVNPNGTTISDCHFEYGTTTSYGASVPCAQTVGGGTSEVAVTASVNGLQPDTLYHFQLVATNAFGTSRGHDETFTTLPPTVSSVSPNAGPTSGFNTITINGTHFESGARAFFGATEGYTTFVSATQLKAIAPPNAAGVVDVTVTTSGGTTTTSSADRYTYDPPPTLAAVVPNAGSTAGGNTVTMYGTNFFPGATVKFGTSASAKVTFVAANQLQAKAPAHAAGTVDVTVSTPGGTSARSSGDAYMYDAPPTVTSVVPNAGATAGGNTVTITGTQFVSGATVNFGTTVSSSATFLSATRLKAVAPAHASGVVDVTVTTPGGASPHVNGDLYAYGPPTVSSFTPPSGITSSSVTINGTNLVPGATVKFGAKTCPSVTFVSPSQINAIVPNGAVAGKISVTTPAGTATSATSFTPTFSITGFSPASGPTGTLVTITGVGFNTSSTVKFNAAAAASVTHVSATQLRATVPSIATSGPITVTNTTGAIGTATSASSYTVTPHSPPTISSFTPSSGITGSTVTISGAYFSGASAVRFGTLAASYTIVSATQITATVPNGAIPGKLSVTTAVATATSTASFTPTFSITGFSPSSGPTGTVVTIGGIGFNTGSTVKFNAAAAASVTHVSATRLRATVPSTATSGPITVTNPTAPVGTATSATNYTKT